MFTVSWTCCLVAVILLPMEFVTSAPSAYNKLENATETIQSEDKTLHSPVDVNQNHSTSGVRQKRWYNFYGYGFPPINPVIYPITKRDDTKQTSVYGPLEEHLAQIFRRLQDISSFVRQPSVPPSPPQFPIFFPVIFIPQIGCGCIPAQNGNGSVPNIDTRFPAMDDPRQNWGIVADDTTQNVNDIADYDEDGTRPITFDIVRPDRPVNRPAPPVDRGTSQAEASASSSPSNAPPAVAGSQASRPSRPRPPSTRRPTFPTTITTTTTQSPPTSTTRRTITGLSPCDGAVLGCCLQTQITYNCFVNLGCPDLSSYENPCDSTVIFSAIDRFQRLYGQRT